MSLFDENDVEITGVTFSEQACVQLPNGEFFSAFQRGSYIARVEFADGYSVVVACPDGAAIRHGTAWWSTGVRNIAKRTREEGLHVAYDWEGITQ